MHACAIDKICRNTLIKMIVLRSMGNELVSSPLYTHADLFSGTKCLIFDLGLPLVYSYLVYDRSRGREYGPDSVPYFRGD